jgi:hypothetical protein
MNLAILSCGPSLKPFLDKPVKHDAYMGVNRSAGAYPCDYWVGLDRRAFATTVPMGQPIIYTPSHPNPPYPTPVGCEVVQLDRVFDNSPETTSLGDTPWWRRSGIYALVVAGLILKAKRLVLYGYDMSGRLFWDGLPWYYRRILPPSKTMDEVRWDEERSWLDDVVAWLRGRGTEVRRVQ